MFFFFLPYGIDRAIYRRPIVTYTLLIMNTLVFIAQCVLPPLLGRPFDFMIKDYGFIYGSPENWRWLTHAFLHGGFMHYFFNMIYLVLSGVGVENRIGHWKTVVLYLVGIICAAALHSVALPAVATEIPLIGASGAIAALMGAFFVLMPWVDFKIMYVYFVLVMGFRSGSGTYRCPAFLFLGFYFFLTNFFAAIMTRAGHIASVAYWAHLGGFAAGALLAGSFYGIRAFTRTDTEQQAFEAQERQKSPSKAGKQKEIVMPVDPSALIRFVKLKQWDQAESEYRALLKINPQCSIPPEPQFELAHMIINKNSLELGLTALNNLIDVYPRSSQCHGALLEAAELCMRIPEKRAHVYGYLNRFINSNPSKIDHKRALQLLDQLNTELSNVDTKQFEPETNPAVLLRNQVVGQRESVLPKIPSPDEIDMPLPLDLMPEGFQLEPAPRERSSDHLPSFQGELIPLKSEIDDSPLVLDLPMGNDRSVSSSLPDPTPESSPQGELSLDGNESNNSFWAPKDSSSTAHYDTTAELFAPQFGRKIEKPEETGSSPFAVNLKQRLRFLTPQQSSPKKSIPTPPANDFLKSDALRHVTNFVAESQPLPHSLRSEKTEISVALLLAPDKSVDINRLLRELTKHTNLTAEEMARRISKQGGILFPTINCADGRRMRDHLRKKGIKVCLVENQPEYEESQLVKVRALAAKGDVWAWETGKGPVKMSPRALCLAGCGALHLGPHSPRPTCAVDLFFRQPRVRLRLWEHTFRFSETVGLDGFRLDENADAASMLHNLTQCLMRQAPKAVITGALGEWLDSESDGLPHHFADLGAYDFYNQWHFLACFGQEID